MNKTLKQSLAALPLIVAALSLSGCGGGGNSGIPNPGPVIGLWTTTSTPNGSSYKQIDRLGRPLTNEVFATVANNRHQVNDEDSPIDDAGQLKGDIDSFLTSPANRSPAIRGVIESVLVPDVLKADLSKTDSAAYLGVETGGATGGRFGGRKLTDDVVDISLGIVFGSTVPTLGLAPDDNHEIPTLTSDHVGVGGKHFISSFPYLGAPL